MERRRPSRAARAADRRDARVTTRIMPTSRPSGWRAASRKDSSIRASPRRYRGGKPRGTPSARSAADRFRAVPAEPRSDRQPRVRRAADASWRDPQALEAAIALLLLCPQIPLLFMGEEGASTHAVPVLHRPHRANWRKPCATAGAANLRGFRNSPIRSFSTKFPIRTPPTPSSVPSRSLIPPGQVPANGFTATCWRCAERDCPSPCRGARRRCQRGRPCRRDRMLADGRQLACSPSPSISAPRRQRYRGIAGVCCLQAPMRRRLRSPESR